MARSGGLTQLEVVEVVNMAVSLDYHLISVMGSGSIPNDLKVVANEETVQADQMHVVGLGERQGFPYQASHALPKGVVEALDVGR